MNEKTGTFLCVSLFIACASATRGPDTLPDHAVGGELARIAKQCALVASCADEHDSSAFRTPQACVDWYVVNARDEAPLAECVMKAK